jgi:hypothetical protein
MLLARQQSLYESAVPRWNMLWCLVLMGGALGVDRPLCLDCMVCALLCACCWMQHTGSPLMLSQPEGFDVPSCSLLVLCCFCLLLLMS